MKTLVWPLRLTAAGQLATAEQGSPADVQSCVVAILSYSRGWRPDNMKFGRPDDILFTQGGANIAAIAEAISDLEPRATPEIIASALEHFQQTIQVDVGAANVG